MKVITLTHNSHVADNILLDKYQETLDMKILGELFCRHSEMVYYVCLRYFKDEEKSKDSVMLIFEQLITKLTKQEIKDFPKWLYVVTKNFCLMDIRSAKKNIVVPLDDFVEFTTTLHQVDDYADKEAQLTKLEFCIDKLPEKQKNSVDLFFIQEKCYKEIVQITGYNMNEVKSFIQNGKRNLKNCMEKNNE